MIGNLFGSLRQPDAAGDIPEGSTVEHDDRGNAFLVPYDDRLSSCVTTSAEPPLPPKNIGVCMHVAPMQRLAKRT